MVVRFGKTLTVGDLRRKLEGVPDDYKVAVWEGYNAGTMTLTADVEVFHEAKEVHVE
ncbi:hypothetical protein SEA_SUCHA_36 [Microbacterium phage Sucha]|nr:hypothetical protein SEA_SUCHA_36 [Microbacterium phage Sucha]